MINVWCAYYLHVNLVIHDYCYTVRGTYNIKTAYKRVVYNIKVKVKVIPQQAEVAQGVPGSLRPRIFLTFGTRVVGRQPYAPAAFTPEKIPGTHFQRLSRPQGTWFCPGYHGKNPQWHYRESIPGPTD